MQDIGLFLVGIIVGAMNAIAGGGMLVGFPALLAVGLSPLVANATTYILVIPGQLASIVGYRLYLRKVPRSYWLFVVPCAAGGAIGAWLLRHVSPAQFERFVPLLLFLAVLLFAVQPLLHFHFYKHLRGRARTTGPILLVGAALFPMSIYGGFFGLGFGFVMLAFLSFTNLHDIHKINGLKNAATLVICLAAGSVLLKTGLIDWRAAGIMAAGGALGSYLGVKLAQKVSSHIIRIVVIVIGIVTIVLLGLKFY